VLLGVVAGTAVISGALIVGDSVRNSLKQMTLDRLGGVDYAMHAPRFVRQELVTGLSKSSSVASEAVAVAPALIMDGAIVRELNDGSVTGRVGGVRVFAIDERFAEMSEFDADSLPTGDEIVLSHRVADQIDARVGEELTLWIELPSTIPRESLLGGIEDQETQNVPLTVKQVLPETSGVGRFDLNPGQQLPLTVFVALETLQEAVGLERQRRTPDFPNGRPARVNAAFASAAEKESIDKADAERETLTRSVGSELSLSDLNLRIVTHADRGYLALESEQMILENSVSDAGQRAAEKLGWRTSSAMVYLVNELLNPKEPDALSMYSIVAGVDFADLAGPPFGPLMADADSPPTGDEIVLNDWLATDLKLSAGDTLQLKYHLVGSHGELPEEVVEFRVKAVVPLAESVTAGDRGLTPEVKGITDAEDFREWKQPFKMDIDRVTDRDDDYWKEYRALPKAFVSLEKAEQLWRSRFGNLTSLRVAIPGGVGPDEAAARFEQEFLKQLQPSDTGLVFQAVKRDGLQAASGTTDFTGLFVGFSFFVIASAMILIGLLFRLGVERRVASIGLLEAIGFRRKAVRSLILKEGLAVAMLGGVLGTAAAIEYADLMVFALKSPDWWGGAIGTQFLEVSIKPVSLMAGFAISLLVAWLALLAALRGLHDIPPRQLLAGATEASQTDAQESLRAVRNGKRARIGFIVSLVVLVAGLVGVIPATEAFSGLSWQVVAFFMTGVIALTAALWQLTAWLGGDRQSAVRGSGMSGSARLGFRNAARHRQRSVLSTGLIACATFVIVAVSAGRRNPAVEKPDFNSGNGGFSIVAEATTPIIDDLNTDDGRNKLNLPTLASIKADDQQAVADAKLISESQSFSFRMRPGENASCLNLYQTQLPTVLGVPKSLIDRGGFRFIDQRKADYWKLLTEPRDDGHIAVVGDMNTLMFSLHKGPGATIDLPNSDRKLVVVGMLDGSVLQGVLLMSDASFQDVFPEQTGFRYFLIGASSDRAASGGHFSREETDRLAVLLESSLTPYGFDAERVADRIAAFLVVQNTYLSTFQSLGGLGLLLGTLGLATVMLRNVIERRSELALLRAVGFRRSALSTMVLAENAFLLIWGLLAGTGAALMAMLPHLLSIGADTQWSSVAVLLLLVFVVGMLAALFAVREAARTPIVSTLRGE